MEVQLIKLNKIKVNDKNPRTITEDKLRRLVESILVFPKMLTIRPIVVDDKGVALGGNMRTRALKEIKKIGRDFIPERLQQIRQYANKTQRELDSTVQALHGQAIDGEDYISKPACRRPTEPEHYDPLNIIIQQGTAYCLASEPKKKPNGALYSPCDLCALRYDCISDGGTEPLRSLCQLHQATDQEYYREVGRAQYAPAFGTIEVVDEMKELELEKKRLEEEDEE